MRSRELTQKQKEFRRFDVRRGVIIKTLIVFLVAILICFFAAFSMLDENPAPLLLFLGILMVYTIITIIVCRHLARKHEELYVTAFGNDPDIIRTGLFGEIWREFELSGNAWLSGGKVVFEQTHNNTIDLQIIRNKHEFNIEVDCESLCMICDEETDNPIVKEIPLSVLKDVDDFFLTMRTFIEEHS